MKEEEKKWERTRQRERQETKKKVKQTRGVFAFGILS